MTRLLEWSTAVRSDRDALRTFACTEKGRSIHRWHGWERHHPRPWEREVQARIHEAHPPYPDGEFLWLGRDSDGLGAVLFYRELDGPGQVEVDVAAVATRFRRRGGGWADELMTVLFDAITARAVEHGVDIVEIGTWIHEKNRPSHRMARTFGMRQLPGAIPDDPALQRWGLLLLAGGADIDPA